MQQGNSVVPLPGFSSQFSLSEDHYNLLPQYGDGTHTDTSYPAYQNTTPQYSFIPCSASNTTHEANNGRTPGIDKKFYCTWPGCRQRHKEYTTVCELRFVRPIHTRPPSPMLTKFLEGIRRHTQSRISAHITQMAVLGKEPRKNGSSKRILGIIMNLRVI